MVKTIEPDMVEKWLIRISGKDEVETPFDEPHYAFKRDVERIMMASRKNMLDAFCTAVCKGWQNHDGNGNPCLGTVALNSINSWS